MLGALPVVAEFGRRLRLRQIVDAVCPMREVSTSAVTHGQVVEVLVANRLTSPAPLLRVEDWARAWAVPEVFGVAASTLGDDRIGRALDAIAPHARILARRFGGGGSREGPRAAKPATTRSTSRPRCRPGRLP